MFRHIRRNKEKGHRSRLETQVEQALESQGLSCSYEKNSFVYYRKGRYTPDFTVNGPHPFHIEVKGYWIPSDRTKTLAVITANPDLRLLVALQKPHDKISKTSKTSYCEWCSKYGIPWTTIPIPPDLIQQWLSGSRVTMHVPNAKAQTQPQRTKTDGSTASVAKPTTKQKTQMNQANLFTTN